MRTRTKSITALAIVAGAGAIVLSCYAFFIKAQAESLLKDITALRVGSSTESDVEQVSRQHARYFVSGETSDEVAVTTFEVRNRWLSALRLEPVSVFRASVSVKNAQVYHISAWLMRSMDIFPTFQASAGIVDEYEEYPEHLSRYEHYGFASPLGKPYLRVLLDSHASTVQRQRAFNFSFSCLIKLGGGCDLPCDYLPSAWQDLKSHYNEPGSSNLFNQVYPNNSKCKE